MKIFLLIVIGLAGGLMGGMGMGGGTLLIPLLVLFTGTEQHIAQSVNLIAFVPMSVVAIIIHAKNKLIEYKTVGWIAVPALGSAVAASFLARAVAASFLTRLFGIFLGLLGIYQLTVLVIAFIKKKKGVKTEDKKMR